GRQEVAVQIHRWVDRIRDRGFDLGFWLIGERLLFHRGDFLERKVPLQVPKWIQTDEEFRLVGKPKKGRSEATYPLVEFNTRKEGKQQSTLLVDFYGGYQMVRVGVKALVHENSAPELLVITPEGDLAVRDGREDADPDHGRGKARVERYV